MVGCGAPPTLTEAQARLFVQDLIGAPLPEDARILHREQDLERGYTLVVLQSPSELRVAAPGPALQASQISRRVVAGMIEDLSGAVLPDDAGQQGEAEFCEWETTGGTARLRQMQSSEGWFATLELSGE